LSKDVVELLRKPIKEKGLEAGIPRILKFKFAEKEEIEARKMEISIQFIHTTFPNAWFKNYNEDYPNSGFYRIWDFRPRNITNQMMVEMYTVINSIRKRLAKRKLLI